MFSKSARFYDAIYAAIGKNYAAEVRKLRALIRQHKRSPGKALLEVACGTGCHAARLHRYYQVEGLDLDPKMLAVAREKCPGISFHQADMVDFDLGRQFDVVTCLFSSIGYVKTRVRLQQAIQAMSRHLVPGGVLLIEPWFAPDTFYPGRAHGLFVDQPDLKIARMNISRVEDGVSILDFHYLMATPRGIRHFTERHELGLFTHEEYLEAFRASGLEVVHDPEGLDGRGLYIGKKPLTTPQE